MSSLLTRILDSSMYSPHGICLLWEPELIWLHVVSDALTAIAYFSIPVCILYIWWKRTDFKYRWIAWLFVAFIVSCGMTHVLAIITLWTPIYGIEGLVKAATAAASLFTAVVLWRMLPDMLVMPTLAQMQTARVALKQQTQQTRNAEQVLQRFRDIEATEPQIRQAQKMEAVGQLTGGIAHDFNNLLTVITGSVDELAHSLDDRPHLAGIVELIDQAASRGAALTAQLLAFARAAAQPVGGGRQHADPALGADVAPHPRRADRNRDRADRRAAGGAGRRGPARDRDAQSGVERARCDVGLRADHHRNRARQHGRGADRPLSGSRARLVRGDRAARQWPRHSGGRPRQGGRAVLHHQGSRQGHRPRAQHGLRLRQAVQRPHRDRERARPGTKVSLFLPPRRTALAAQPTARTDAGWSIPWWRRSLASVAAPSPLPTQRLGRPDPVGAQVRRCSHRPVRGACHGRQLP